MRFELKPEHLKLLRHAYVYWQDCETGAPEIDPKRPYGNSGVATDVGKILDMQPARCPHCDEPLEEDASDVLLQLHRETEMALQIVLSMAGEAVPPPGIYEQQKRTGGPPTWIRITPTGAGA